MRRRLLGVLLVASVASCAQALPHQARVEHVIDGDTIELEDNRLVRYIGLDTPELRRRHGEEWIVDPEPYGREAKDANERLVGGKTVTLEYDAQTHDRYHRLLAYVYVDGQMVNEALLAGGYATLLTIPPDVKYAKRFRTLSEEARTAKRGLWAERR